MPIFEYICNDCNKKFEELVFRSDAAVNCPDCKSSRVQKLVSAFSSTAVSSGGSSSSSGSGKHSFG